MSLAMIDSLHLRQLAAAAQLTILFDALAQRFYLEVESRQISIFSNTLAMWPLWSCNGMRRGNTVSERACV